MQAKSRNLFRHIGPLSLFALLATHCVAQPGDPQSSGDLGGVEQGRSDRATEESVAETQSALIHTQCASSFTLPNTNYMQTNVVPLGCFRTAPGFHRGAVVANGSQNITNCIPVGFATPSLRDGRALAFVQGYSGTCTITVTQDSDCAHAPCTTGGPLDPACSPNVAAICARDPSCCTSAWVQRCVDEVATFAEESCN